jgi:hypothetical protein
MLYAYCDESGHEQREQYMFLAGFLGNEKQWRLAATEWRRAGGGPEFHTTSLVRRKRSESKLARLATVPTFCGLRPIVTGVRMSDYWDLVSGSPDEKRAKGWCVALYPLVLETLISIPNSERATFIFEEQFEYQPYAHRVMNAVAEYPDQRLRTETGLSKLAHWDFLPKEMTILTQPADYLAFSLMSFFREPGSQAARLTKPMLDCIGNFRRVGAILSREKVRQWIKSMPSFSGGKRSRAVDQKIRRR